MAWGDTASGPFSARRQAAAALVGPHGGQGENDQGTMLQQGLGLVGGVIGAYFGGPQGAMAGYSAGTSVGKAVTGMSQNAPAGEIANNLTGGIMNAVSAGKSALAKPNVADKLQLREGINSVNSAWDRVA